MRALAVASLAAGAAAHAAMNIPPPRAQHGVPRDRSCNVTAPGPEKRYCDVGCFEGSCLWYQVGCMVGCDTCSLSGKEMYPTPAHVDCTRGGEPVADGRDPYPSPRTISSAHRTWNIEGKSPMGDFTKYMPWSAPGASALVDPCGVASGFGPNMSAYAAAPPGYAVGDKGTQVLRQVANVTTEWVAGGTAEVGFGFRVNHGGGYSYRLCPKSQAPTEQCFQSTPLAFASETTTARWPDGSRADVAIAAVTVTDGTTPQGSAWRRIPVPACNCDIGANCMAQTRAPLEAEGGGCTANPTCVGAKDYQTACKKCSDPASGKPSWSCDVCCAGCTLVGGAGGGTCTCNKKPSNSTTAYEQQPDAPSRCPTGLQFPAPADDLYGYEDLPPANFVDEVRVPDVAGEYILSWRWDCEQTPQIWSSCADVTIKHA